MDPDSHGTAAGTKSSESAFASTLHSALTFLDAFEDSRHFARQISFNVIFMRFRYAFLLGQSPSLLARSRAAT